MKRTSPHLKVDTESWQTQLRPLDSVRAGEQAWQRSRARRRRHRERSRSLTTWLDDNRNKSDLAIPDKLIPGVSVQCGTPSFLKNEARKLLGTFRTTALQLTSLMHLPAAFISNPSLGSHSGQSELFKAMQAYERAHPSGLFGELDLVRSALKPTQTVRAVLPCCSIFFLAWKYLIHKLHEYQSLLRNWPESLLAVASAPLH